MLLDDKCSHTCLKLKMDLCVKWSWKWTPCTECYLLYRMLSCFLTLCFLLYRMLAFSHTPCCTECFENGCQIKGIKFQKNLSQFILSFSGERKSQKWRFARPPYGCTWWDSPCCTRDYWHIFVMHIIVFVMHIFVFVMHTGFISQLSLLTCLWCCLWCCLLLMLSFWSINKQTKRYK